MALNNLDANLLGGLKTIKRLPLLHLFALFSISWSFSFSLSFFFSGDHLFYLNSGPLTFSPVGSCLKKKSPSLHPVHFCYISIFSVLESSLDRGYHAKQNRTFFFTLSAVQNMQFCPRDYWVPWFLFLTGYKYFLLVHEIWAIAQVERRIQLTNLFYSLEKKWNQFFTEC